jgi:hypothetical protein
MMPRMALVLLLLRRQIALRDVELFVLGVACQANHFHPIEQRRRDIHRIAGGHEHHVGEIEINLDVMVTEPVVLFGVEHLEQRRRGITTKVHAQLVDFVEQEQGVAHPHLAQALQHLARHGTDVGTAVTTDLGFVAHTTQSHAHELAAGGTRHALAERGLADPRRPDQAQDRRLDLIDALLHGQVLEDAVLDLLQTEVVFIEHTLGMRQVVFDLGLLRPRQADQGVDEVAHHSGFGRHG